jgi:C4-dicarboxylate-specific signal transduction histidine kinase
MPPKKTQTRPVAKKKSTAKTSRKSARSARSASASAQPSEAWDPLESSDTDAGVMIAVQRREITNILKSYTGYYDLFSELIQNALDAVDRHKQDQSDSEYNPKIWITVDMRESSVAVMDNGCGMTAEQFRNFRRPNFSFKDGRSARGSKGVGATYLAYGFRRSWSD